MEPTGESDQHERSPSEALETTAAPIEGVEREHMIAGAVHDALANDYFASRRYNHYLDEKHSALRRGGDLREGTDLWRKRQEEAAGFEGDTQKELQKITSPFEELYELNPERFAQLPTSEFIEIAKKFKNAKENLELAKGMRDAIQKLSGMVGQAERSLSEQQPVEDKQIVGVLTSIALTGESRNPFYNGMITDFREPGDTEVFYSTLTRGGWDDERTNVFSPPSIHSGLEDYLQSEQHGGKGLKDLTVDTLDSIRNNLIDSTPRQNFAKLTELFKKVEDALTAATEQRQREFDEFKAQYTSGSTEPSNLEQE